MALFTQHPADGVDYVRFAASVRANDARRARAAERHHGAFAERFESGDFHFAEF